MKGRMTQKWVEKDKALQSEWNAAVNKRGKPSLEFDQAQLDVRVIELAIREHGG